MKKSFYIGRMEVVVNEEGSCVPLFSVASFTHARRRTMS